MNTILNKLTDVLIRKHPWQAHFFYETLTWSDIVHLFGFIFKRKSLQDGEYIAEFNRLFNAVLGGEGHVFNYGAGRMALYSLLEALGVGEDDEVIVPAFTCEVVIWAILYRKAKVVYADIDPNTLNLDTKKIEALITDRTKIIIAQHTFGVPCDLDKILSISRKHEIAVLEDCALSLGSKHQGRPLGTFGDGAFFSTDHTKTISTLSGGVAYTRRKDLAEKLSARYQGVPFPSENEIRNIALQVFLSYFLKSPYTYYFGKYLFSLGEKLGLLIILKDNKESLSPPINYPRRMSNLQAYLGIFQLGRLSENLRRRHLAVMGYHEILQKNGIPTLPDSTVVSTVLRYSLLVRDREQLIRRWRKYFDVGKWFDSPAVMIYDNFEKIGYKVGSCPQAEYVHRHIINFPTHQNSALVQRYLNKIIGQIKKSDVVDLSTPRDSEKGGA